MDPVLNLAKPNLSNSRERSFPWNRTYPMTLSLESLILCSTENSTFYPRTFFLKNSLASNPKGSYFGFSLSKSENSGAWMPANVTTFVRGRPVTESIGPAS